jgi:hypothetical protein
VIFAFVTEVTTSRSEELRFEAKIVARCHIFEAADQLADLVDSHELMTLLDDLRT